MVCNMAVEDKLWQREEAFWTGTPENARAMTSSGAVMIFPYPVGIMQGDAIWDGMGKAPRWRTVQMTDRTMAREGDTAVLAYRASAEREGASLYEALCASTYLRDEDDWLLIAHQQMPLAKPTTPTP